MTWKPAGPYTADDLRQGTRVRTPYGDGGVAYVRMDPPTYARVGAVSVMLDARSTDINYSGTIVPAHDVTIITEG